MNLSDVFTALLWICLLILLAKLIRRRVRVLKSLFLPSSIIAGALALLAGPQVLGRMVSGDGPLAGGVWSDGVLDVWSSLPGLLISVVFATLFLGKSMPNPRQIWRQAGPMVCHGQSLAWGQYVVGIGLVLVLLTPVWDFNPLGGALIEIGFEGGHGTAAGLAETFRELGFEDGADLALGLATVGVVMGVVLGTLAINWAVWRGHIERPDKPLDEDEEELLAEHEGREETPLDERFEDRSIEPLSIHLGFVALAVAVGWLLLELMVRAEAVLLVPLGWPELMRHIPLFPLAMIGGVLVQLLGGRVGFAKLIDRGLMNRISGTALDVLIVAALGALSLEAIGANAAPFAILMMGGIMWNLFGFFVVARMMFPRDWVPNGLANFGQGMGMTVVGLLLVRMSDPRGRSGAMESFGYKQLLFEPVVGGGLFTAASLPLIHQFGALPVFIGVTVVMAFWLVLGFRLFRKS